MGSAVRGHPQRPSESTGTVNSRLAVLPSLFPNWCISGIWSKPSYDSSNRSGTSRPNLVLRSSARWSVDSDTQWCAIDREQQPWAWRHDPKVRNALNVPNDGASFQLSFPTKRTHQKRTFNPWQVHRHQQLKLLNLIRLRANDILLIRHTTIHQCMASPFLFTCKISVSGTVTNFGFELNAYFWSPSGSK